jgi:CheY-like chemotaxis protein
MERCYLPACYFQSTVLLLDEHKDFYSRAELSLNNSSHYTFFESPHKALAFLAEHRRHHAIDHPWITYFSKQESVDIHMLNVDLSAIHHEIYSPQRFQEVTVIVADHTMPGMNGLDFFEEIKDLPVKKILLTGHGEEHIAVKAFNHHLIDVFLNKNNPRLEFLLNQSIGNLQKSYFCEASQFVSNILSINQLNYLSDPLFAHFIQDIADQVNAVEFYLMESSGSFLLLDKHNSPTSVLIKSDEDIDAFIALADRNHSSSLMIEQLKNRSVIPYFWQPCHISDLVWDDWSMQVHPAKKISCGKDYYYAIIQDPWVFDLKIDRISSWDFFMNHLKDEVIP